MKPSSVGWLTIFCQVMSCSPSFAQAMERQLPVQLAAISGIKRMKGFFLVPPDQGEADVRFDQHNTGYVQTDLVGPDNFGHAVTVAWRCGTHDQEQIKPSDEISQERGCNLHVWWAQLPDAELRTRYAHITAQAMPVGLTLAFDPSQFAFRVEWWPIVWPEVWLELYGAQEISDEQIAVLDTTIVETREAWNERKLSDFDARGLIHNIGVDGVYRTGKNSAEVFIDFGSAPHEALLAFLQALQHIAPVIGLSKVVVRYVSSVT